MSQKLELRMIISGAEEVGVRVSVRLFLATSDFFVVDSNGLHDIFQESVGLFCRFVEILSIRLIGQS